MGFPAGFISGFTLVASTLYLSSTFHRRNRLGQSASLQQQHLVLRSIVEPLSPAEPPREIEYVSLKESVKDQWNRELEGMVRSVQGTDWRKVGEDVWDGGVGLWNRALKAIRDAGKDKGS